MMIMAMTMILIIMIMTKIAPNYKFIRVILFIYYFEQQYPVFVRLFILK